MAVEQVEKKEGEVKALQDPIAKYEPSHGMTKQEVVDEFHKAYYSAGYEENLGWQRTQWMGFPLYKMPSDCFNLVDIMWQIKPQLIIECGTAAGASALFMACYLDACGTGKVLTIDISPINRAYPAHPRIAYLGGRSSVDEEVLAEVRHWIDSIGGPVMVILDSDHSRDHVLKELEAYHGFVTPGSYLIVEDTNVNGHPVLLEHGPGPWEACEEFFPTHPEFKKDNRTPSYHLFSQHGWYRRMKT